MISSGILSDLSPVSKFFFSLFIIIISFLFTVIIASIIAIPLFGINFFENPEILSSINNPDYLPFFRYYQIIQSVGLFIIPPLVIAKFFDKSIRKYYNFIEFNNYTIIIGIIILMFTIQPVVNFLLDLNKGMSLPEFLKNIEIWMQRSEANAEQLSALFLNMDNIWALLFNMFMMAIIPAIGEELFFRGRIQRLFSEWLKNIHISIILTAIFFSGMHLQFYGFIPRFLLGVIFGYLFIFSGTIWAPIIAHFINNAFAVIVSYLWQKGYVKNDLESFGNFGDNYLIILLFAIISAIIIYFIYKQGKILKRYL